MRRSLAFVAACTAAWTGLAACSDTVDTADTPLADVCKVADLELISMWQGGAHELVTGETNDCSYRSVEFGTVVHITAERSGGAPKVHVRVKYDDPTDEFDDLLLAGYLEEAAYGAERSGPSIADRAAALSALPDGEYPCSVNFIAGSDAVIIATSVDDREGDPIVGALSANFGSALLGTQCNDEVEANQPVPTVEERWPATYTATRLELPPRAECGPATVTVFGVTVYPPDGSTVELGDLTMTNTNWMVEPPFECRRT